MGLASPSEGYPDIKFAGTHLYTWLERGTVRVKCLTQEHNTMSLALGLELRLLDLHGVQCTKHEAPVCQQQKDGMLRLGKDNFNFDLFSLKQVLFFLVILLNYSSWKNCTIKLTFHPFQKFVTPFLPNTII